MKNLMRFSLAAVILAFPMITAKSTAQTEKDPHRPACNDAPCKKIKAFVKTHYCGESPYGNGPDDGCLIVHPTLSKSGMVSISHFSCEWSASDKRVCKQEGQVSSETRGAAMREMRQLGLPATAEKETYFNVWKSNTTGWILAEAYYQGPIDKDDNFTLCQVILLVDPNSGTIGLRKLPFRKADVDVPRVTTWEVLGLADADSDGHPDIILQGNAYEDYWVEVVALDHGSPRTVFSGLGFYL